MRGVRLDNNGNQSIRANLIDVCSSLGEVTISNDGATIMKLLDIVHPAAKTLVDIARSQDAEVSDLVI